MRALLDELLRLAKRRFRRVHSREAHEQSCRRHCAHARLMLTYEELQKKRRRVLGKLLPRIDVEFGNFPTDFLVTEFLYQLVKHLGGTANVNDALRIAEDVISINDHDAPERAWDKLVEWLRSVVPESGRPIPSVSTPSPTAGRSKLKTKTRRSSLDHRLAV